MRTTFRTSRRVALLAAVGLHLLGGLILLRALESGRSLLASDDVALVWLSMPFPTREPRLAAAPPAAQAPFR
ncbi:MAG: hypothetical protein ACRES2_05980, partial [Steroidobacteraceae bacterium]